MSHLLIAWCAMFAAWLSFAFLPVRPGTANLLWLFVCGLLLGWSLS